MSRSHSNEEKIAPSTVSAVFTAERLRIAILPSLSPSLFPTVQDIQAVNTAFEPDHSVPSPDDHLSRSEPTANVPHENPPP